MKSTVVVSEKGQVTIPKRLRMRLGITPGTQLCFEERDGHLLASRVLPADPLDALVGMARSAPARAPGGAGPLGTDAELESMRGPGWAPERDGR
jgi:AbrB family looped-hinge helix DNA binding protein